MSDVLFKENTVVWVNGAATGIGKAVAERFVSEGAQVVATDIKQMSGSSAQRTLVCNVTDATHIEQVIAACETLGGVDILVNCAGIMRRADILEVTPELWDSVFDINVKGAFLCSQAAARSMQHKGRGGCIINIGSVNAQIVFGESAAYCSSKGALHAMTRSMALALAPDGIRVNTVAPGAIADTALEPERWNNPEQQSVMRNRTPLGVLGSVDDIAPAVVFLSSSHASFATGATLYLDGGRTASV